MVIFVSEKVVYVMAKQNVDVSQPNVELNDVASIYCSDKVLSAKVKALIIYRFKDDSPARAVISILKVIEQITILEPGIIVENVGNTDIIVEKVSFQKDRSSDKKSVFEIVKICLVGLICFWGSGFTIMSFHNDVGITDIFARIYELVMGRASDGVTSLEVSYSIGLAVGIITFYNHIGGKKITSDPTPLEVEMRNYERDVNQAIIENADRQKVEQDVE